MSNTWKVLYHNLSKSQRIGLLVLSQVLVVIIVVLMLQPVFREKEHVEVTQESDEIAAEIPMEAWKNFQSTLWQLISDTVDTVSKSVIDDAVIREGTYKKIVNGGAQSVNFIVDIDSIKQTYAVSIGWSDNIALYGPDNVSIECPPKQEMKYPETVCYGMYNNTYSLDLYLPHAVYPEGYDVNSDEPVAPLYIIHGDESSKTIDVEVSMCDVEKYRKEALDYLNSLPISIDDYKINYQVNEVDVDCRL